MQKLVRGLAAVTALTAALLVIAGGASATTSWTATRTLAVHLAGTPAGTLASSTPLSVDVALRLRNTSGLDNAIAQGAQMTPAQFKAGYAPSDKTLRRCLHRLGYRWKRPRYVLGRPDPAYEEKRGPWSPGPG